MSGEAMQRRRPERIRPISLIRGVAGDQKIAVMNASLTGIGIAHQQAIGRPGDEIDTRFEWDGRQVRLRCEIRWSKQQVHLSPPLWHSGFRILSFEDQSSSQVLRDLVLHYVERAIDEQKANARGLPAKAAQSFQTGGAKLFRRHELIAGRWVALDTTDRKQSPSGFTIAASSPPEEVAMLRAAYEAADREGASLIRKLAELSISSHEGIPTRRYQP
jgi:hypothetical protein